MAIFLSIVLAPICGFSFAFFIIGFILNSSNNLGDSVGPAYHYVRQLKYKVNLNRCSYGDCEKVIYAHKEVDRQNDIEHDPNESVLDNAYLDADPLVTKIPRNNSNGSY